MALLWTPAVHNSGEACLLGIVCNKGTELKDGTPEMTVRTPHHVRRCHGMEERAQDLRESSVVDVLDEEPVLVHCCGVST